MRTLFCCAAAVLCAAAQATPAPRFQNVQLKTLGPVADLTAGLHAAEQSQAPHWWGYSVGATPGRHSDCGVAYLESSDWPNPPSDSTTPETLVVLVRLDHGAVAHVRSFVSPQCAIDAGGLPLDWSGPVDSLQSVALLASLAANPDSGRGALTALAESADPAAVDALIHEAQTDTLPSNRGQALFWLAQRAGDKAVGAITAAIANDPDTAVKERAVAGLSQLPHGDGVPLLITVAQKNTNPAVRKRAIFYLGQSKDPRALQFFETLLLH